MYSKIVISVIAIALSVIALHQIVASPAQAQGAVATKVLICDPSNVNRCVGLTEDGKLPVLSYPKN